MIKDQDIINALKMVAHQYGKPFAARIEQLYRNETTHFKSGNFLITLSPGMQALPNANNLPYGWASLANFWALFPQYAPTGLHLEKDNDSKLSKSTGFQRFLIYPDMEASMMTVAKLIHLRGDDAGTWFSNNPASEKLYDKELDHIIPRFVNANIN